MGLKDIISMNLEEIKELLDEIGEKPFRANQIFEWLHNKNVKSFDQMTNISNELKLKLKQICYIDELKIVKKLVSTEDDTIKYLLSLSDNNIIESVVMSYNYGVTICISSQVGCKMGCQFCASTIDGFVRNLKPSEMLDQVYTIQQDLNKRISNIVVMGSGEPFDNFDNLIKFIEIVNSPKGLNIGQRHITVSTSGIIDKIYDFADKNLQVTLAISLHAPNDIIRQSIMPIAKKYSIAKLIESCKYYTNVTNRRITFEYSIIDGINDSEDNANELARLLKHMLCHVNLIAINEIKESTYKKGTKEKINNFATILKSFGIEISIRKRLGSDIDAACGQLRRSYLNKTNKG